MPELPDVESERRYLKRTALSRRVRATHLHEPQLLKDISPQALYQNLSGHALQDTHRHGKYLFIQLDNGRWLTLHFGMTGTLEYYKTDGGTPRFAALTLELDNDYALSYISKRKLGRITLVDSPRTLIEREKLGPDALDISRDEFSERLDQGRGGIKSWLMNQSHVAGIGNIYADEILFQAGIDPRRALSKLTDEDIQRLHERVQQVLNTAIEHRGEPQSMPKSWLLPRRDDKSPSCPRCGTSIKRLKVNGRTSLYCPICQS